MANYAFNLKLADDLEADLSVSKFRILEAIALAYSNESIANEYGFSVKNVESSFKYLCDKFGVANKFYNKRMRLLAHLCSEGFLLYIAEEERARVVLKEQLYETLLLSAIGLTNKALAKIFGITEKSIEQRFAHLFDHFAIDSRNTKVENPRVLLFVHGLLRGNLDQELVKKLYFETMPGRLERIIEAPEYFLENLSSKVRLIG